MRRAAVLALAALGACTADGERTGLVVTPGMFHSVPFDAYHANRYTPTGQTLLEPPEGTVPWGVHRVHYGPSKEEAARAGRELESPLEPSAEILARGKQLFDTFCFVCHGPSGNGDGPIIGRFPNPPNLNAPHARQLPDGQVFHILTHGQGIMPSYAVQVRQDDRWRLVHYLRALQGGAP